MKYESVYGQQRFVAERGGARPFWIRNTNSQPHDLDGRGDKTRHFDTPPTFRNDFFGSLLKCQAQLAKTHFTMHSPTLSNSTQHAMVCRETQRSLSSIQTS